MKVEICPARVGPYIDFVYRPVRYFNYKNEIRECPPEEANMWGVYTKDKHGETEWIADCDTEQEATELIVLFNSLITGKR